MKIKNLILSAAVALAVTMPALSQDYFNRVRIVQLCNPASMVGTLNSSGAYVPWMTNGPTPLNTVYYTNTAVDVSQIGGVGFLYVSYTNNCQPPTSFNGVNASNIANLATSCGFMLNGSSNGTSWYPVTNACAATLTSLTNWNMMLSTAKTFTNNTWIGGTLTYPTASSSGFATPYVVPTGFLTTTTCSVTGAANTAVFGLILDNLPRYVQAVWTVAGSNNVLTGDAILVGGRNGGSQF